MDNDSIVKVRDLSHRYSVQWAVRDLNFEIDSKGVVGLLGSNGAGKSTTMNIICGVLSQTRGEVFIGGVDIRKKPIRAKRNLGFLPQKPPLYEDLTVEEYLRFCADIRLIPKAGIKESVEKSMEKLGIARFRNRLIHNLSGGYQQRVGFAGAIIHEPRLVVLDEPTNGLDPNQILEIRNIIRQIGTERCVFLSTHILSEVQATCDRIMMIEGGSLIFNGTIREFENYIEPDSLYVRFETIPQTEFIENINGVTRVEEIDKSPYEYRVFFDGDRQVSGRIIKESIDRQWDIAEIQYEKTPADEIFAQLSRRGRK